MQPEDSAIEVKAMPNGIGKLVVIPSNWGHMGMSYSSHLIKSLYTHSRGSTFYLYWSVVESYVMYFPQMIINSLICVENQFLCVDFIPGRKHLY